MARLCRVSAWDSRGCSLTYSGLRLENTAGTGFDPSFCGTNATSIPQKAVVVEDNDSSIQYSPSFQWAPELGPQYHADRTSGTTQNGTSVTFTFEGVAVW